MSGAPELSGYRLDQLLLGHPLAEIWRGRSFTGMEIVALVLSEAGAADPAVRERLGRASRDAALEPGQLETPLWAANFSADRPYAITQLVPGQSGAERLIDPLDGLLGNDEQALDAVRNHLSQYGAAPAANHQPTQEPVRRGAGTESGEPGLEGAAPGWNAGEPVRGIAAPEQDGAGAPRADVIPERGAGAGGAAGESTDLAGAAARKPSGWVYVGVVVGVLVVFSALYAVGVAVGAAVKDEEPAAGSAPALVSPGPLPSSVLLPPILKIKTAAYAPPSPFAGLVGATYAPKADVQVVDYLGLPFAFGFPRPPEGNQNADSESASMIYRRAQALNSRGEAILTVRIALHPCENLSKCLADRAAFDAEWTKAFKAPVPTTVMDSRTWFTQQSSSPYALTMSHAFAGGGGGRWWLVGVAGTAIPDEVPAVQRVVNDIWRQTQ